jgi:formate dehydrogenase gamma subunit
LPKHLKAAEKRKDLVNQKEDLPMSNKQKQYLRFSVFRRVQHWVNTVSFLTLGLTGLIQKFNGNAFSLFMLDALGGIESVRIIHRISAIVLVLITIVHIGDAFYSWYVDRKPLSMLPGKDDITNAWGILLYNLGFRKDKPKQGFYTFEEKFEYWALIWGTVLMGVTGFVLWNPILANKILPGAWIPAAKAAHGLEAVLAVVAILIWHMYHVFIKHFNKSMYTGMMSHEEMEHHHPKVLEDPAYVPPSSDDARFKRRKRFFFRVYSVLAVGMLAGLVWLVTAEDTAVETIPPIKDIENLVAFSPLAATDIPEYSPEEVLDLGATWNDGVGDFVTSRCAMCHTAEGGLGDLSLATYEDALAGGKSGPAVKPGASGISPLVLWPQRQDHPLRLEPAEIAGLRLWIDSGAPVGIPKPTPTPAPEPTDSPEAEEPSGEVTYNTTLQDMLVSQCGACHGTSGGLDVTTYEALVAGGDSGAGIVSGDLDASVIYQVQLAGGHFGQFSEDDLSTLEGWILAGAPEEAGTGSESSGTSDALTYDGALQDLLVSQCGACHGTSGGLDVTTYEALLAGGASGAGIVAGDLEASVVFQRQLDGGHFGQFSDDALSLLEEWILAGAPEN